MLHGQCCFLQKQLSFLHGLPDLDSHVIDSSTSSGAKSHPLCSLNGINLLSMSSFSQPN